MTALNLHSLKLVMFDLDGTLVDSVPDLAKAANHMLRAMAKPAVSQEQVTHWVGNGAAELVKRCLARQLDHDNAFDKRDYERALSLFFEFYSQHNGQEAVLYPGVKALLAHLKAKQIACALVTNKPEAFTLNLLQHFHLRFDMVVGGDTLSRKKPDPAPLLHCLTQLNLTAQESIMIGDSVSDVEAARRAGVPVVCVSYGYNHGRDIRDARPDLLVDSLLELI